MDQGLQEALAERQQRLSIYKDALAMPAVRQEFRQATARMVFSWLPYSL